MARETRGLIEVTAVVLGQTPHPWEVVEDDLAIAEGHQTLHAQLPQDAVDAEERHFRAKAA